MPGPTEADKAAYKRWLTAQDKNIKPLPATRGQVEKGTENEAKNGFAVPDETDRKKGAESCPQGELFKAEFSAEQLAGALDFFKEYLPQIKSWIEQGFVSAKEGLTLEDEIKRIKAKQKKLRTEEEILFYPEILMAFNKCLEYKILPNTEMFDLIKEIERKTRIFSAVYIKRMKQEARLR